MLINLELLIIAKNGIKIENVFMKMHHAVIFVKYDLFSQLKPTITSNQRQNLILEVPGGLLYCTE